MEYLSASSVSESDPGGEAELNVWNRLKRAFNTDERGVLYHQYPIIQKGGNRFDRKPDFVLLHEEMGLVILECKGYTIDQIDRIEGDTWILEGVTQKTASPLEQARDQGFHLQSYFQRESRLRSGGQCVVSMTPVVMLPSIERSEWEERGFTGPAAPRVITGDELGAQTLRDRLDQLPSLDPLSKEEYDVARAVLSCGQPISGSHGSPPEDPTTRGEYYDIVTTGIRELDMRQQEIGLRIPPGPQQIRGIAGSGKTVLVAMKAARMLSDPDEWAPNVDTPRIALTFKTKSLYEHITSLTERFYQRFGGEQLEDADAEIDILHGWGGGRTGDGVYYRVVNQVDGVHYRNYSDAKSAFPDADDEQEAVVGEVLEKADGDIPDLWDAILVDEAQDFGPQFLNLCLESLTGANRLIWAYDEAQDLGSLEAPSPKNLFGTDEDGNALLDLSGTYKNGPQKTYIMRKAYRSPHQLLMTAHALGMGLKRDGGPVQMITRQDGWENLGYNIDGDFRKTGSEAVLTRPTENSPHPLQGEYPPDKYITHRSFASKADEIEWIAEQLRQDIFENGLDPEDLLVISLSGQRRNGKSNRDFCQTNLEHALDKFDIELNTAWASEDSPPADDEKAFKQPGEVTLSGINRAKGNEAASVYVMGADSTVEETWRDSELKRRNQLFVALTRSRAWCTVTGTNPGSMFHSEVEAVLEEVQKDSPTLSFEVPESRDLDHELEEDTADLVDTGIDDFL
ncbi:DEAD/DEAH box helicase [Halorubrum halophilum]|uniref:DEAD/DEAH box helicase n=1 Tax=Halorubrum halophilum TaxID=413816 RepID=UPI000679151A|nr:ATP-binding domain-containing protein [Halorubrum halophilum]